MSGSEGGGAGAAPEDWVSPSVEATERAGARLADALREGDVIALSGPLGAGKTRLVAGLAHGLGWRGEVRSPTFTLVNEYRARLTLVHVDLYRVDTEDVEELGLGEYLDRGALAVEWGEKLPGDLVDDALLLEMALAGENERRIAARATGPRGRELIAAWMRAVARPDAPRPARAAGDGGGAST